MIRQATGNSTFEKVWTPRECILHAGRLSGRSEVDQGLSKDTQKHSEESVWIHEGSDIMFWLRLCCYWRAGFVVFSLD